LLEWCAREEVAVVTPTASQAQTNALLARHPGLRLGMRDAPTEALDESSASGPLMHGIDWMCRSVEGSAREIQQVDSAAIPPAILGRHAADFLGLRRGRSTRMRLEGFYDRHDVAPPAWMRALDASGPDGSTHA